MVGSAPSLDTILSVLTKQRLAQVGRTFDLGLVPGGTKDATVEALVSSRRFGFRSLLRWLLHDELRSACRLHGLDESGRSRTTLAARLLQARGDLGSVLPPPIFGAKAVPMYDPRTGDLVQVRHRQHLVERVSLPPETGL